MVLFRFFFESFRLTRPIEALPGPVIRGVEFLCFIKEFQLLFQTFDGPFFFFKGFAARTDRFVGGKEDLLLFCPFKGCCRFFKDGLWFLGVGLVVRKNSGILA